jgi:AraC-like DNA-binding protein
MEYKPVDLPETIRVEKMVTVHYFQFARGYVFPGEKHDFWELVYMDRGTAELGADGKPFLLREGEAAFHKPGEFHTIWAGGEKAPDIVVLSFVCRSRAMGRFAGARLPVDGEGRRLIAQIITEARGAWANRLSADYAELAPREGGPAGAGQMVRLCLETLLIRLLRAMDEAEKAAVPVVDRTPAPKTYAGRKEYFEAMAAGVESYIAEHMGERITIPSLCRRFGMSATSLKQLFRSRHGGGVTEYLSGVRHEAAKRFIREGRLNMSAIAEACGYGTIHYFSRKFTRMEGMTPSEYVRSVRSMDVEPD